MSEIELKSYTRDPLKRASQPLDPVQRPSHYNSHPSGVETARVTEHFACMLGCALKYIWRRGLKGPAVRDLEAAVWCLKRERGRADEFHTALWDCEIWKPLAVEVIRADGTVLGEVLLHLLGADLHQPEILDVCVHAVEKEIRNLKKEAARVARQSGDDDEAFADG
jgi:hypothetical protein